MPDLRDFFLTVTISVDERVRLVHLLREITSRIQCGESLGTYTTIAAEYDFAID